MSKAVFGSLFQNKVKQENVELKKDIEALTSFSSRFQSIDQKTYDLINSSTIDSTNYSYDVLVQLWKEVPDISTVLSKITDRAKNIPWRHYKIVDGDSYSNYNKAFNNYISGNESFNTVREFQDKALEPVFNNDIAKLLSNPNDLQTWGEMIEQSISYYYVIGDAFFIKNGLTGFIPKEISVMASQQTDVIIKDSYLKDPFQIGNFKKDNPISHYEFNNDYGQITEYDPDIVIHIKAPNIEYKNKAWRRGFSPLASAILASRTLKHEYISRLSLVRDRGMMGMIVGDGKNGAIPTPDETKAVYERLQKFGLGDGKTNPYGATNGAFKWLNMSLNSGELELLNDEGLKVLARKFNVPTDLLIGDSTFNNVNTAGRIIYTSNVMPWLDTFKDKLNESLGLGDRNQVLMPVYDNIPELQQDMKVQTDIMSLQYNTGLVTREEARIGVNRPAEPTAGEFKDNNE